MDAGTVRLVGTDREAIVREIDRLLGDSAAYEAMAHANYPYGDGLAAACTLSDHVAVKAS